MRSRSILTTALGLTACILIGCEGNKPNPSMKFDPKGAYDKDKTMSPRGGDAEAGKKDSATGAVAPGSVKLSWVGTKPGGKHTGGFEKVTVKVEKVTPDMATAQLSADIDTTSITSDDAKLTNHLKGGDFFLVSKYPTAKFVSTGIQAKKDGDNTHEIKGELTIKDVKAPVTFPAKITVDKDNVMIAATFKINRTKYGITYGPGKIDDDVEIKLDLNVPATK